MWGRDPDVTFDPRIAGWCQRMRPFLHNVFHIGDQIISVNSQVVENAKMARKLIKVRGAAARFSSAYDSYNRCIAAPCLVS